jgi:hypothetical protein
VLKILFGLDIKFKDTYSGVIYYSAIEAGSFKLVNYLKQKSYMKKLELDSRILLEHSLLRNHVDMYAYLYRDLKGRVGFYENEAYNVSPTTVEVLLKNNMISKEDVKKILSGSSVMSQENKKIISNILQQN